MKTVVDRRHSQVTRVAFNEMFNYFSKDAGFKRIACRPFRLMVARKKEIKMCKFRLSSIYEEIPESCKVSKEAMVIYNYQKYSVPIFYIGKPVTFIVGDGILRIYDRETIIRVHHLSKKPFNYHRDDYVDVL